MSDCPIGLAVTGLSKRYGDTVAVSEVSLAVDAGAVLVLVGPSGCGKSTILRLVAGLEEPTAGTVEVAGRDVTRLPPGRRRVGMVFQEPAAFPYLSVADNLAFGMKVRGIAVAERRRRVGEVAELLGLGRLLERRPVQLSGGERQRVELGRALLRDPDLLLLDEPLSGLDAALRVELRGELRRIQREVGTTTVLVTHDQTEALVLGDRVGVLQAGRLRQLGTPSELFDAPANTFVARFVGSPPMNLLPAKVCESSVVLGDARLLLRAAARPGEAVLGVRSTDIELVTTSTPETLAVTVEGVEDQGADMIITGRLEADSGTPLLIRLPRADRPHRGDRLDLAVRRWHLFDPVTGERLDGCGGLLPD